MRLLKVELDRFRSRRAIVLVLVVGALLTAVMAFSVSWETRSFSDAEVAAAQARAERQAERPWVQREISSCEQRPEQYGGPGTSPEECADMITPTAESFLWRPTLSLEDQVEGAGVGLAILLGGLMLVVGATFAGADWASGSMSNQLLFDPRRNRVWWAKAGALTLGAGLAAAVLAGAFWVSLYLVAESRDITTSAAVLDEVRAMVARTAVFAGLGGLMGYALTMLLRHTVGTLGLLFAYVVGGEIVVALLPVDGIGRWSLGNNILAWLSDGYQYWDESLTCPGGGFGCDKQVMLTLGESVSFLAPLLLAVVLLSAWSFHRRDIP